MRPKKRCCSDYIHELSKVNATKLSEKEKKCLQYRAASLPTTKSKRIKIGEICEKIQTSTTPSKKTSPRS
jgi:hypothetical protein